MNKIKSLLLVIAAVICSVVIVMGFATVGLALIGFSAFVLAAATLYRMFNQRKDDSVVKTY